MTKKLYLPLAILIAFSMLFSACAPSAPARSPRSEEPTAPVEAPVAEEPVEEGADLDGVFGDMLANMKAYNTIKADALLVEMAEDTPPFLLDVRTTAELEESGHIEGATHIPLNELAQHIDLLPGFRHTHRGLLWHRLARHHCHDSVVRHGLDRRARPESHI